MPEQYHRLGATPPPYRGKPPYSFQVMSEIPQSRQAIFIASYGDTALYGDTVSYYLLSLLWARASLVFVFC